MQGALYGARSLAQGAGPVIFAGIFTLFSQTSTSVPYFPGSYQLLPYPHRSTTLPHAELTHQLGVGECLLFGRSAVVERAFITLLLMAALSMISYQ